MILTPRIAACISIPKNASKSILSILQIGENRDLDTTDSPVIYENHQRGEILSTRHNLEGLYTFCFCRNPYERCVSWYEYHQHIELYQKFTFNEWVREGMPHHFTLQNQTDYVREKLTPLLQLTYVRNTPVDFIGRVERFEKDIKIVINELNRRAAEQKIWRRFIYSRFTYSHCHTNKSRRIGPMASYYTNETLAIVGEILREDFKYFQYPLATEYQRADVTLSAGK